VMGVNFMDPRLPDHFWAKVSPCPMSGCWLWMAANVRGYGHFAVNGKPRLAHRHAYAVLIGAIPDGQQLDHKCRVHDCVNPAHLEPVSSRENTLRGFGVTATNSRKLTCRAGHPFDSSNTQTRSEGWRVCRACRRERQRKLMQRRREAHR
jgi:hypothetical protein